MKGEWLVRFTSIALLLSTWVAAEPALAETDCYAAGGQALASERWAEAAAAFRAAAESDACQGARDDLKFNEGFALQKLAESGDTAAACAAVDVYDTVVRSAANAELSRVARERSAHLADMCRVPMKDAAGGTDSDGVKSVESGGGGDDEASDATTGDKMQSVPDRTIAWTLTAAASAAAVVTSLLYALALDADTDRAAAKKDYLAAVKRGDIQAWETARERFYNARDSTDLYGYSAWVGLGASLALGGIALYAWTEDRASVVLVPRGVVFSAPF